MSSFLATVLSIKWGGSRWMLVSGSRPHSSLVMVIRGNCLPEPKPLPVTRQPQSRLHLTLETVRSTTLFRELPPNCLRFFSRRSPGLLDTLMRICLLPLLRSLSCLHIIAIEQRFLNHLVIRTPCENLTALPRKTSLHTYEYISASRAICRPLKTTSGSWVTHPCSELALYWIW